MRSKIIVGTILVIFLFSGTIIAQEKKQKVEVPKLTLEQKWQRAEMNATFTLVGAIAYAKSLGKTPSHVGKYLGEIFATSWGEESSAIEFIEAMHWNWQMWTDFQIETLEESENFYKAKIKGCGEKSVTQWTAPGVTVNEYFDCLGQVMVQIAEHVGLKYEQNVEGDWVVFTVTEKK